MNGFGWSRSEVQGVPMPFIPFKLLDGESRRPISASKVDCGLSVSEMDFNTVQSYFQLVPMDDACPEAYYHIVNVGSYRALTRAMTGDEVLQMSFMNSLDIWEVIPANTFPRGYYLLQEVQSHRYLARGDGLSVITVPQEQEIGLRHMWMFSFMEGDLRGIPPTQTPSRLWNLGSRGCLCIGDTAARRLSTTCEMPVVPVEQMDLHFRLVAPVRNGLFSSAYLIESVLLSNHFLSTGFQGRRGEYINVRLALTSRNEENSGASQVWTIKPCSSTLGSYFLRNCAIKDLFLSALPGSNSVTLWRGDPNMRNVGPFQQWTFLAV